MASFCGAGLMIARLQTESGLWWVQPTHVLTFAVPFEFRESFRALNLDSRVFKKTQ